jgi:hypothetical protein
MGRLQCLLYTLSIAACGSNAPRPLGVQSNVSASAVVLRLHPPSEPIAFATLLRIRLDAELLGQPLQGEVEARTMRRIDASGNGGVSVMDIPTQLRLTLTRVGHTHTTIHDGTVAAPVRYVLDDRGRPAPVPRGELALGEGSVPPNRMEQIIGSLMHALEFPLPAISPGAQWESRGSIRVSDIDPALTGEAAYRVLERLDRFEGSGEQRAAVISFEALFEGAINTSAPLTSTPLPLGEGLHGRLRLRGAYSVALVDGFARVGRAEIEGDISLGETVARAVSWSGTMEWNAVPFSAEMTGLAPFP